MGVEGWEWFIGGVLSGRQGLGVHTGEGIYRK